MKAPTVSHRQRYGRTTNWRPTAVYVDRQAVLSEKLDYIKGTKTSGIVLVIGDGYSDANRFVYALENAAELHKALGAALDAVREELGPLAPADPDSTGGRS